MSEIKSVAIVGASGKLGGYILKALVDANFQITVLTRQKKTETYSAGVKVVEVDYTSIESLTTAFKGVDAVVSTVGGAAIGNQHILIDAAIAAGVKHFIPSEFGSCTTSPKIENNPVYAPIVKTRKYLQEKAKSGKLTWTVLACGGFLEFVFAAPGVVDFANHKVTLLDEGDNRFSTTSLPNIGKAVAASLKHIDVTKNKVIRTSETIVTQNKILSIAKELKPEIKWEISKRPAKALLNEGLEQLGAGDHSFPVIIKVITATAFGGDEYGSAYDETDNELLGIKELTEEDLKNLVADKLTQSGTKKEGRWSGNSRVIMVESDFAHQSTERRLE